MSKEAWGSEKPREVEEGSAGQAEAQGTGPKLCAPGEALCLFCTPCPLPVPHLLGWLYLAWP